MPPQRNPNRLTAEEKSEAGQRRAKRLAEELHYYTRLSDEQIAVTSQNRAATREAYREVENMTINLPSAWRDRKIALERICKTPPTCLEE